MLKAGLVTEEQVKKAESKPKFNNKNKRPDNAKSSQGGKQRKSTKPAAKKRELTDLEQFYQARDKTDKAEKAEQEKQKKEAARLRKEKRAKIGALIKNNLVNDESAEHRYNFVVGSSVK